MNLKKNNSGFVLILSLVLLIFLGIMLEASSLRSNIELQESMERLASQQAFYAAESGLQAAVNQLRINANWNPGTIANPGASPSMKNVSLTDDFSPSDNTNLNSNEPVGSYSVEAPPSTPPYENYFQSVFIKSTGTSNLTGIQSQISRSILGRVVVQSPTNFFLSTAGDLHIASGATIDQNILGNNVYFDVNQSLLSPQNQITIEGKVFFLDSVNGNDNPAVNIAGGAPVQSPTQTFSGVDTASYSALAQNGGTYVNGNLTVSGDISKQNLGADNTNGNTPNTNGVVFATGDITISGQVDDSMIFVAGGNVYIDGDVIVPNGSDGTLPQNNVNAPQLGILAEGDVIIPQTAPSDMTIDAFVMADGGPGSQGGIFQAQGAPLSKGNLNILGSLAVRGTDNATTAVNLNTYATRNYQYNTQFQNNIQIPFLPAIAKIVTWREVLSNCDITLPPNQPGQPQQPNAC